MHRAVTPSGAMCAVCAVHEASWVLNIVHLPDPPLDEAIVAIVAAYKTRFHQVSVLRVSGDACVSF